MYGASDGRSVESGVSFQTDADTTTPLIQHYDNSIYPRKTSNYLSLKWTMAVILLVSGCVIALTQLVPRKAVFATSEFLSEESKDVNMLNIMVMSDYETKLEVVGYIAFRDGVLVEPCRKATLSILNSTFSAPTTENMMVEWKISCPHCNAVILTGDTVTTEFDHPGDFQLMISLINNETLQIVESAMGTIFSRYVRRELRALSSKDRNSFFSAFKTLLTVDTQEGQLKYGAQYHSIIYYLGMHLTKASKRRCDNFHDGLGFPTQHLAMTNEFELAIQSVNPVLAVPYWDVTYDQAMLDKGVISNILNSSVFKPDWFGKSNSEVNHVIHGRWADSLFPMNASFEVTNAWGYMRSPWNLNPSKYVTRFNSICGVRASWEPSFHWPSCSEHYNMTFDSAWSSWNYYAWSSSYRPHGPVHIHVGGAGGDCAEWDQKLAHLLTPAEIDQLRVTAFLLTRNGYRREIREGGETKGFLLEAPEVCSLDTPADDCKLICYKGHSGKLEHEVMETYLGQLMNMEDRGEALISSKTLNLTRLSYEQKTELIEIVFCRSNFWAGDQLESSSPVESLFWVIHPTMDRLIQYKQLTNPFKSLSYLNPSGGKTVYCRYHKTSDCEGHHPGDLTFFKTMDFNMATRSFVTKVFTNEELLSAINPLGNYSMQYVYDNFKWDHCEDVYGLKFPDPVVH